MSQVIDLCRDSGDGKWPNTASVPSLPRSSKRPRDEESSYDAHPRNENGPGNKTTIGSAEFIVDLELADEVEVSVLPHKKRRGAVRSKRIGKNDAARTCAQILKGAEATERDVGSEDAQVTDHRESHEGIAAAESQPMNSDSEQTSQNGGSINKHSQELSTSKPPSNAPGRQERRNSAWEDRLTELADYRKIHGHCNVPQKYSENTKLAQWVATQRKQYRLHEEGKTLRMTTFRIKELEILGFEWGFYHGAAWEDRLSELADYRKIHGHCNVPQNNSENTKLGEWVKNQRKQYRLHQKGETSSMTAFRIKELESLSFEWEVCNTAWEDCLTELAEYRKINGHCNVPRRYSENPKLGRWVGKQRTQYRLYVDGKKSPMTTFRIQELESLGFEWGVCHGAAREDRLGELADYRNIHGHCNVPSNYSENTKLGRWVGHQRTQYRLYVEGKTSPMTTFRIQELEGLGFEWKRSMSRGRGSPKKPSLDEDTLRVRERAVEAPEHMQQHSLKKTSALALKSTSISSPKNPTAMAKSWSTSTTSRVEPQNIKRVKTGEAPFDGTDLDGSPSDLSAK
jgi:hypothetical protein